MNYLMFDGTPSTDFSCFISGENTFRGTARSVDTIQVPGRNGALIIDNGFYNNIEVNYPAFIVDDFDANFSRLRAFLLSKVSYFKLTDTYHPNEFRLARAVNDLNPSMTQWNREGSFVISFNCKPQRFLVSGEQKLTFTESAGVTNPTYFASRPMLRVYGNGTLQVGRETIVIAENLYPYIDIDCDLQNAVYEDINCNSLITVTDFPTLLPGENGIVLDGITEVEVTPRWYTL